VEEFNLSFQPKVSRRKNQEDEWLSFHLMARRAKRIDCLSNAGFGKASSARGGWAVSELTFGFPPGFINHPHKNPWRKTMKKRSES
jgi:hypothetical protein